MVGAIRTKMQSIWVTTEGRRKRDEVPREVARAQPFVFGLTHKHEHKTVCMRKRHGGALLAAVCAAASVPVGALAVSRSVLPLKLRGGGGGVFAFFSKNEPPKRTLTASSKMSAAKA